MKRILLRKTQVRVKHLKLYIENIIKKLSQEMGSFHEALHEEIENRNKGEANLIKLVEEAQADLLTCLEQEKADREETEEGLVKLLEDTCQRIEQSITSP